MEENQNKSKINTVNNLSLESYKVVAKTRGRGRGASFSFQFFLFQFLSLFSCTIQKFGFINGVDNVNWPPYRDSKS